MRCIPGLLKERWMEKLEVSVLGDFCLNLDARSLSSFVSDKARALLTYLALEHEKPHPRTMLAGLLWESQHERASRTNLRQALYRLLQVVGCSDTACPYLFVTSHEIQFNRYSSCTVDAIQFQDLLQGCEHPHLDGTQLCQFCLDNARRAVSLYRGDLLMGISLPGCQEFVWWLTCKQEMLHQQMMAALVDLVCYFECENDFPMAQQYIQQAIGLEPWNEGWHRKKMILLSLRGQRNAALRQFEQCRQILAKELQIEPELETVMLYQQIKTGSYPA
jgi:DNA-binding SARP family transcriptional activator